LELVDESVKNGVMIPSDISPMAKKVSNSQLGFDEMFQKQIEEIQVKQNNLSNEIFSEETNIVFPSNQGVVVETGNTVSTPKHMS
jgi:hypothetical protein